MRFDKKEAGDKKNNAIIRKLIKTINNEGFYLVLFLCFCIVAAAAVWTVKANVKRIENLNQRHDIEFVNENKNGEMQVAEEEDSQPVLKEDKKQETEYGPETSEIESQNTVKINEVNEKKSENEVISSIPSFSAPVKGNICLDYSGDTLVYSKTLEQYILHKGIDIEAPLNTPVCAAADGIVTKVEEDRTMGITICIDHDNGFKTVYANLSTMDMVHQDKEVKKGDVISGIGDTALFEILEVPHLHFEVIRNQRHEDPRSFIDFK